MNTPRSCSDPDTRNRHPLQLAPAAIRKGAGRSDPEETPADWQKWQLQGLSFFTGRNTREKPAGGQQAAQRPRSWYPAAAAAIRIPGNRHPLQLIPGSDPGGSWYQVNRAQLQ